MAADETRPRPAPFLRVVRGDLSPEETAALVAVLTARAQAKRAARDAAAPPAPRSAWRDRSRLVRPELRPGPGAWRSSFRPG
ncbi:acyl-CoA carboxylase subunit epsilon [Actinorugispora endophytica]|uniref:Acyl-CoA carboxylase epsilon subunit-like protein n=1 Tax=Actinorugispora endophytica TaxID=1605990 RepID=A0A4R6UX11_9ACTN|nr:acyl-CoA carboxylase subunit epsilon [Actinorugispora endophytica]TDQ51892.1 acyl-CoA carboxylase epsilon subunit-like protein [Actinorugispora endophytica]